MTEHIRKDNKFAKEVRDESGYGAENSSEACLESFEYESADFESEAGHKIEDAGKTEAKDGNDATPAEELSDRRLSNHEEEETEGNQKEQSEDLCGKGVEERKLREFAEKEQPTEESILSKEEESFRQGTQLPPLEENKTPFVPPAPEEINIPAVKTERKKEPEPVRRLEESKKPYFLKNGQVGQSYSAFIDLEKISPKHPIQDYTIEGLDGIGGVRLVKESNLIEGVPKNAGEPGGNYEFDLTIRYRLKRKDGSDEGEKDYYDEKRTLFLKILPNPKALWKDIEPPDDLTDRKEHCYKKAVSFKDPADEKQRTLVAASKRGRSHAHKGLFRDDHVKVEHLENTGWSIMAVADGAGSARLSRVGSHIACETVCEFIAGELKASDRILESKIMQLQENKDDAELKKMLYEIIAVGAFKAAKAIEDEAKARGEKVDHFSTTLIVGIQKSFDFGKFFSGFWIGDGALTVYDRRGWFKPLGAPDGGEYSGQTRFLTTKNIVNKSEELIKRIYYEILDDYTAFFAMTDGISDPKFGTDNNLLEQKFWDALWEDLSKNALFARENADKKLLEWLDFWAEGEHDDRTIAVLY